MADSPKHPQYALFEGGTQGQLGCEPCPPEFPKWSGQVGEGSMLENTGKWGRFFGGGVMGLGFTGCVGVQQVENVKKGELAGAQG